MHAFEISQQFERGIGATESFDQFLDRVLDELYKLEVEADYLANLKELRATWTISVEEDDSIDALIHAMSSLRSALHAADCKTADWITRDELKTQLSAEHELTAS